MRDPFAKFRSMTYRSIQWQLRREEMPEDLIDKTIAAIKEQRSSLTNAKRKRTAHKRAWDELIAPLQHERRIVRSMVNYKTRTPSPEREQFAQDYYAVLSKAYDKLAALRAAQDKLPEHDHWTDYVPDRIKDAFIEEAALIPPRAHAKMKIPFERTVPALLHNKRKTRMMRHIYAEIETASAAGDTDKAKKLRLALDKLKALPDNAHIPGHWSGLLK